jgi:hypothetical protein
MKTRKRAARRPGGRPRIQSVPVVDGPLEEFDAPVPEASRAWTGGGPRMSGGDVDADWKSADAVGEEAVGGSVATPDQDVVDEIGEALGVAQDSEAEVTTSEEILRRRDRLRWHLELDADVRARAEEERAG